MPRSPVRETAGGKLIALYHLLGRNSITAADLILDGIVSARGVVEVEAVGNAVAEAEIILEYSLLASVLEGIGIVGGEVIAELCDVVCSLDYDIPSLGIEHSAAQEAPGCTLVQTALGCRRHRKCGSCCPEVFLDLIPAFLLGSEGVVLGDGSNILIDNDFLVALDELEIHPSAQALELAFEPCLVFIGHCAVELEILESLVGAAYGSIESAPIAHIAVHIGWSENASAVSHLGRDVAEGVVVVGSVFQLIGKTLGETDYGRSRIEVPDVAVQVVDIVLCLFRSSPDNLRRYTVCRGHIEKSRTRADKQCADCKCNCLFHISLEC